jgi:hypothetical protein
MKHKKDTIFGILIGIILFVTMTFVLPMYETYQLRAEAETVDNPFTAANSFSWLTSKTFGTDNPHYRMDYDDVFGSIHYENLYLFVFQKTLVEPDDEALRGVALQYGLTLSEADAVRQGAMSPIIDHYKGINPNMTQQEVINIANQLRKDFNDAYELYSLQQELMVASTSSEIFSNGELLDSGFDLIHDLTVMEELLFNDISYSSIGSTLGDDKEYVEDEFTPYEQEEIPADAPDIYDVLAPVDTEDETEVEVATEEEFDATELVEVLEEDVCPPDEEESVVEAVEQYEDVYAEQIATEPGEEIESEVAVEDVPEEEKSFADKLNPEEPDDWELKVYCDGPLFAWMYGDASSDSGLENNGQVPLSKAQFYMCFETSSKWETYSSYVPNKDKCVQCELDKILGFMNKTLSHSLAPNKVTGNYLESSKCKDSLSTPGIDMQFFVIWEPVQTPPQNDAIFGKSIVDEWNKFIKRNDPLALRSGNGIIGASLLIESQKQQATDWAYNNMDTNADVADVLAEINRIDQQFSRQQAEGVEQYEIKSKGEDFVVYAQTVIREIGQMSQYFKNYMEMFKKLDKETCKALLNKPDVQ